MSFRIKAKCIKLAYKKGDFTIHNWSPIGDTSELKLSRYLSFSTKGENLYITVDKEYELELEEISHDPQYGGTYKIISCPTVDELDIENLSREESFEILMDCTSSDRLANNILDAYPNYIKVILKEGKEAIDTSKIKGVGEAYNSAYAREILAKFKYYKCLQEFKDYKFNTSDCKDMYEEFGTFEEVIKAMQEKPYYCLCRVLKRSFDYSDRLLMEFRPELEETVQRCEFAILDVLLRNEMDGSTRLDFEIMEEVIADEYNLPSSLLNKLEDICDNSVCIHHDKELKALGIMDTYVAECQIANYVTNKLNNSKSLDIDHTKYTEFDGFKMTDKQAYGLEMFCKYNFSLLVGYSGCVDADTEYFNGTEWKKISEYQDGESVLQYTREGNAELVKPNAHVKIPCDYLWHFETKYGISQTLSDEHRIIYYTPKGVFKECTMLEMKDVQELKNGNLSGFTGKIPTTFKFNGVGIDLTDEEIRVMCAIICDGTFNSNAKPNWETYNQCRFHIKKERKKERLRMLFREAKIHWKEKESSADGYTDFYIDAPRREKVFGSYWYNCSNNQLQVVCDEILNWDGSDSKGRLSFSANVKDNIDFVQFAFTSCGKRANLSTRDRMGQTSIANGNEYTRKSIDYSLSISDVTLCGLTFFGDNKTKIEKVPTTDGYKHCFRVPSGMLVLRKDGNIFCTGNSGKTTSVNGLIKLCEDNGLTYTLLAPTGRASLRMTESTHRKASTIHRKALKDAEINTDVLIVDECSMIDLPTFVMMLNVITNDDIRLVLVGDNAQLMPVGIASVFNDIINSSKVPMTMLTDIFRYSSNGAQFVATNVRQGIDFFDSDEKDENGRAMVKWNGNECKVSTNYMFIQTDNIFDKLVSIYMELIDKGVKPNNILCLSPFNVGSEGTYAINSAIQSEINPPKPNETTLTRDMKSTNIVFRLGDRLLNKKNDYGAIPYDVWEEIANDPTGLLTTDDFKLTSVFNGQDGVIREIDDKKVVAQFDEELIVFDKFKLVNLLLGYCISVHSSQGSEADYVINVVSPNHKRMLNRNLLYVADTRAKKKHWDIGDVSTYKSALLIDGNTLRNTWLLDLLTKC